MSIRLPWFLALWLLSVAVWFTPLPAVRAAAAPDLTVDEIVKRSVARDDALRERRLGMVCDQIVKTETLDSDGKVTATKTDRTVHTQTKEISYSAEVGNSKDGGAEVAKKQSEHIVAVMNMGKLAGRFQMTLAGEEKVRGKPCYVVRYSPKGGQSSDTREEKVVNNLKGRFWISKEDFSILQSEGSLSSPVTVALIASVNRMDFVFHSQAMPNGDTGPGDFSVNIAVKAPFYDFREKKTTTQENWRAK